MSQQTLGQRIAAERKKLGLSQEALGEKMGVSRQAISKWESDGAVPEIDKLIAMSKLFGVSVGWLLGVEAEQPAQSPTLSEEQMDTIGQIIRQYQTPPTARKWPQILALCLSAAALVVSLLALNRQPTQNTDDTQQISSLQSSQQMLQSELQSLRSLLESEAEDSAALLLDYAFQFDGCQDADTALISFSATPKHWNGYAPTLSVSRNGALAAQASCEWNGAAYTATLELPIADDYRFQFSLPTESGGAQLQLLDGGDFENLASSLKITLQTTCSGAASYSKGVLEINDFQLEAQMPVFDTQPDLLMWQDLTYGLYVNGKAVEVCSFFDKDQFTDDDRLVTPISVHCLSVTFFNVELSEGDRVELRFRAQLRNGMEEETTVSAWTLNKHAMIWSGS